jgi:hypothetical protein
LSQPEVVRRPTFRERFSRWSAGGVQGLSGNQKLLLYGLGAVGAIGVGYVLVKNLSQPGPPGGGCADPNSPCYQAIQPYQQAWQQCANEFGYYQHQFDMANAANQTGLTQEQITTLDYYRNCMDTAAESLAITAKDYIPIQGMQELLLYAGYAIPIGVVVGLGLKYAPNIIRTLRTPSSMGSAIASNLANAIVRDEVQSGIVTAADAAVFSQNLALRSAMFQAGNTAAYDALVIQKAIAELEAAAIKRAISSAIKTDVEATIGILLKLRL